MVVFVVVHRLHSRSRTVGCFHLLEACMVPFVNMKASSQIGNIQVSFSPGVSGPGAEVYTVFSNRDLPSTSWGQPGVIAIVCNVLQFFLNNSTTRKRAFHALCWGVLMVVFGF